ncbi:MAG: T9SS type A sorting domain-containing protein [Candidatus Kapabacteria bacterium]|nr:T9SS type A sorting domain-containing protein [Candidatus Kapabacteria bacterium]
MNQLTYITFLIIFTINTSLSMNFTWEKYISCPEGTEIEEFIAINKSNNIMFFPHLRPIANLTTTYLYIMDSDGNILSNEIFGYIKSDRDNEGFIVRQFEENDSNYYLYCLANRVFTISNGAFSGYINKNKKNGELKYFTDTTKVIINGAGSEQVLKDNDHLLYSGMLSYYTGTITNQYTYKFVPYLFVCNSITSKFERKIAFDSVPDNGHGSAYSLNLKKFDNSIYLFSSFDNVNDSFTNFSGKLLITKIDTGLNKIWQKNDSTPDVHIVNSAGLFKKRDKLILFGNTSQNYYLLHDFVIYETDTNGSYSKFKTIKTNRLSWLYSGFQTDDGGFLLGGISTDPKIKFYLVKVDSNYDIIWEKFWGKPSEKYNQIGAIKRDNQGNIYLLGHHMPDSASHELYFAKISESELGVDDKINNYINSDYSLYPNPIESEFNLSINSTYQGNIFYEISDLIGSIIKKGDYLKEGTFSESFTINIQNLNSGTYFLKISEKSSNKPKIMKLIKY